MDKLKKLSQVFWFALIALGHPIVFFLYLTVAAGDSFGSHSIEILGYQSFEQVETNVYRMNPVLFALFAFGLYAAWLYAQILCRGMRSNYTTFLNLKLGTGARIISFLGLLNVLTWSVGMEGNIFGFLFALPLLALSIASFVLFIKHTAKTIRRR